MKIDIYVCSYVLTFKCRINVIAIQMENHIIKEVGDIQRRLNIQNNKEDVVHKNQQRNRKYQIHLCLSSTNINLITPPCYILGCG